MKQLGYFVAGVSEKEEEEDINFFFVCLEMKTRNFFSKNKIEYYLFPTMEKRG
jgi:hypothetical protein